MNFYGTYQTNCGLENDYIFPKIDFMEFLFPYRPSLKEFLSEKQNEGEPVTLCCDWDRSEWGYDPETGKGFFQCKGVCINEMPAGEAIELFKGAKLTCIQFYAENCHDDPIHLEFKSFEVDNGHDVVSLPLKNLSDFTLYVENENENEYNFEL